MAIAIILRKRHNINKFRDMMIDVIRSGCGDSALLCSGFFQERKIFYGNVSPYQVSQEANLANVLAQNNIQLTTVGIHSREWIQSYRNFRDNLIAAHVNIDAKYNKNLRWHAKVFIISSNGTSIFGIIGSSNMTRSAFSVSKPFNYECDVILWSDKVPGLIQRVNELLARDFEVDELIKAPYLEEENGNLSVEVRLDMIKAEIFKAELIELD
jgi:hypothetical protein